MAGSVSGRVRQVKCRRPTAAPGARQHFFRTKPRPLAYNQMSNRSGAGAEEPCREAQAASDKAQMSWLATLFPFRSGRTDEQAMGRVQMHDDHEAFAELVRRWEEPVRRLCSRMTGDPRGGEDLAQEAFIRVFANRRRFQPGSRFSTWLWRIALNLCHDETRRVGRRGECPLDEDGDDGGGLAASEPAPDEALVGQERAELVRAALLRLPETHRAVVVLREYEGLKLREIAAVLDIPEGTVKSRLADALTQLARRLQPVFKDEIARPARVAGTKKESVVI